MDALLACLNCFPLRYHNLQDETEEYPHSFTNEKANPLNPIYKDHSPYPQFSTTTKTTEETAIEIFKALSKAEKPGYALDLAIQDIVAQTGGGWYQRLALAVLDAIRAALKDGSPLREAMREAYERASEAAKGIADFAREHPLYTATICAVIALGILVILAPYIIEALGFGALGPVEGSWAAAWQSTFGGVVEADSLFAYLQRLGMTYK